MENSKTNHIVNADAIFINNRNDLHSNHIDILTKGQVGDNDLQLTNMNINITSGGSLTAPDLRTSVIKDTAGNTTITLSSSSIDFHNKTINYKI